MRTLVAVGAGILYLELPGDGGHIGLRGVEGYAVLEAADGEEIVTAAAFLAVGVLVDCGPELSTAARRELKVFGQDANDRSWGSTERYGLADRVLAAAEAPLPCPIGEHDGRGALGRSSPV